MALAEQSYTSRASVDLVYLTSLTRGGTFLFDGDLVFCN